MQNIRTPRQNKRMHQLFNQLGITPDNKADIVSAHTGGRQESTKLVTFNEAKQIITFLEGMVAPDGKNTDADKCQKMRRKILAICHSMGWYVTHGGGFVLHNGKLVLDFKRIDNFCIERGNAHKKLNDYNLKELTALVTIFEKLAK